MTAPPLDLETVRARLGGDEPLLREILALFSTSAPELLQQLRAALAAGDVIPARRLAHTLKGEAVSIGARGMVVPLQLLEEVLGRGRCADGIPCLTALEEEIVRIERYLATAEVSAPGLSSSLSGGSR